MEPGSRDFSPGGQAGGDDTTSACAFEFLRLARCALPLLDVHACEQQCADHEERNYRQDGIAARPGE